MKPPTSYKGTANALSQTIRAIPYGVVLVSFVIWLFTSCSSTAQPAKRLLSSARPTDPFSTAQAIKTPGFHEILRHLKQLSPDELKNQLNLVLSSHHASQETKQEAAYMLARLLQKSADSDEAISLFEQASKLDPLWERCQWHISECAASLGQEKSVRRALTSIKEQSKNKETKAQAEYGLAQSYLRGNEPERAKETFALIRELYPSSQWALGAAYYLGESALSTPDGQADGLALFRQYLKKSPDGHFAPTILDRLTQLKSYKPTADDLDSFGQVHFIQGEWQKALNAWTGANLSKRWFERATCLARLSQLSNAKDVLLSGIKSHLNDPAIPEAAQLLCKMLSKDQAIDLWKMVYATNRKFKDVALWNLAIRAKQPEALAFYKQIVDQFPKSSYASESMWWLVWDQIKHSKSARALAQTQAALTRYPSSKAAPRYAFWCGKLYERLRQPDKARHAYQQAHVKYPSSYYGHRAQARLSQLSGAKDMGWSTQPLRQHPNPTWSWPGPPHLLPWEAISKRYGPTQALLSRLGLWDECLQLLPDSIGGEFRSWLLSNLGLNLDAINIASLNLNGIPTKTDRWQLSFPLLYGQLIANAARTEQIDPLLVHALIREESRYNPLAQSKSNALGLMQLLSSTAYGVAKTINLSLSGVADILEPENNIRLGTHYLAHGLQRAGGNAMLAVAGYNGGPNAVKSWFNTFHMRGSSDLDVFVEDIPFSETRDYVRKVFSSYWNYQAIYCPTN